MLMYFFFFFNLNTNNEFEPCQGYYSFNYCLTFLLTHLILGETGRIASIEVIRDIQNVVFLFLYNNYTYNINKLLFETFFHTMHCF